MAPLTTPTSPETWRAEAERQLAVAAERHREAVTSMEERDVVAPQVVARLAPAGIDSFAVAQAAANFEAIRYLRQLTERVLADVDPIDGDARSPLAPADLGDLRDRLETAWRSWREQLRNAAT